MAKDNKQKSTGNGAKIAIIVGVIVVIAIIATVIVLLILRNGKADDKRNVVVNQKNAEQVASGMISEKYVKPGYYNTQMSTTWHFSSGDAVSKDAYVKNDAGNTNDVYFDVFIENDESTPILKSPVIPRGSELNNIALDKKLSAGTYNCVMVYHLVDDKQKSLSTLRVGFKIIVEK